MGKNYSLIKKTGTMLCDIVIWGKPELLKGVDAGSIEQLKDAASLPGAIACFGLPDIHIGYGLPIGGVVVIDTQAEKAVISPGAVGLDITCGVRILRTPLTVSLVKPYLEKLLYEIPKFVTTGLGGKSRGVLSKISKTCFKDLLENGVPSLVKMGIATAEDVEFCEDRGRLTPARMEDCSQRAIERGIRQLGTLGSGNHFVEIQKVAEIYDKEMAKVFALEKEKIVVMIHCGSRGFGEQTANDYISLAQREMDSFGLEIPTRQLAAFPLNSSSGQSYLSAMNCAVSFARVNRQVITHEIRGVFGRMFGIKPQEMTLLYDIAHNLAKFEEHSGKKVLIHRKGAIRAFPGKPALIPGSMGAPSFVCLPTEEGESKLWGSLNHGAGRCLSRKAAKRTITHWDLEKVMGEIYSPQGRKTRERIYFRSGSGEDIRDEAPQVYKDINLVVDSLAEMNLLKKVVRLLPLAVLKG